MDMEKDYQKPVAEVVLMEMDRSILESSLTGSRSNYSANDGWEDVI